MYGTPKTYAESRGRLKVSNNGRQRFENGADLKRGDWFSYVGHAKLFVGKGGKAD